MRIDKNPEHFCPFLVLLTYCLSRERDFPFRTVSAIRQLISLKYPPEEQQFSDESRFSINDV